MIRAEVISGAVAFALTALSVPVIIRISTRWGLYDSAGPLTIHVRPTSRLGGVSIALSIIAARFAVAKIDSGSELALRSAPLLAAFTLLFGVGLADDLRGLSPGLRLAAQALAASFAWFAGWRIPAGPHSTVSLAGTCLFILIFVNAFNFLDGADGLAAGTAAILAVAYATLPGIRSMSGAAASSIAGATTAFLCFNFPAARIFMGDSGSTTLGFAIACLALDSPNAPHTAQARPLFLLFAAALPLLDLVFVVVRRAGAGRSPFFGDRRHLYDLLRLRGWTPRRVALSYYICTAGLTITGWMAVQHGPATFEVISVLALTTLGLASIRLGVLRMDADRPIEIAAREIQLNQDGRNPI